MSTEKNINLHEFLWKTQLSRSFNKNEKVSFHDYYTSLHRGVWYRIEKPESEWFKEYREFLESSLEVYMSTKKLSLEEYLFYYTQCGSALKRLAFRDYYRSRWNPYEMRTPEDWYEKFTTYMRLKSSETPEQTTDCQSSTQVGENLPVGDNCAD